MTTYRYCATNLLTGKLLADKIPLNVESFSQQLNGGGTLTGQLDLSSDYMTNGPFINALECRKAVLWVLADDYPVWNGVVSGLAGHVPRGWHASDQRSDIRLDLQPPADHRDARVPGRRHLHSVHRPGQLWRVEVVELHH